MRTVGRCPISLSNGDYVYRWMCYLYKKDIINAVKKSLLYKKESAERALKTAVDNLNFLLEKYPDLE
jgi:hypothetical protein